MTNEPILKVENLDKHFSRESLIDSILQRDVPAVRAVDSVSFELHEEERIGIIGESGCGKTTLLKTLMGIHDRTAGDVVFKGKPMSEFSKSDWKQYRKNVSMIFQDPFNSLDSKFSVREIVKEPLHVHGVVDGEEKDQLVEDALAQVELRPVESYIDSTPNELSGGERQRVGIARAIVTNPDVILADEPVSMLDVSTRASVLDVMRKLVNESDMSVIYISHDLSTVTNFCDIINVMYLGRIVERRETKELINDPKHPYTKALLGAIPRLNPEKKRERSQIKGAPGDPINIPEGCRFKDRCPKRMEICDKKPVFKNIAESDETSGTGMTACHLYYDHNAEVNTENRTSGQSLTSSIGTQDDSGNVASMEGEQ